MGVAGAVSLSTHFPNLVAPVLGILNLLTKSPMTLTISPQYH